ncbi:MAG: glutaredoxin 3 [Betaproteobacteria bacterium]|jgi:glutaredoxin 3
MSKVVMYSTDWCPFCSRARKLLESKGVSVEKVNLDDEPDRKSEMIERTGRRTVPQIFIDDYHVGGHEDLVSLDQSGRLDELLAKKN